MNELKQIRNIACLALAKTVGTVNFLDVGAAAGPNHDSLKYLIQKNAINFFGLEPDLEQIEILRQHFPTGNFIPKAVADKKAIRDLYLTAVGGCSSLLEPNWDLISQWPIKTWMEVKGISKIEVSTIDNLINENIIPIPDYIKIDIQGTEYEALTGMEQYLSHVTGIELETTLKPIYKEQKIFDDIYKFLGSNDFILRDIQHQGPFEGELVEFNAFFSKKPNDSKTNIYKLKLWEFLSEIESPPTLAQIQLQSNNHSHELWREITDHHKSLLLGELS